MTNHRLTIAAGIAVLAAALSLYSLLLGTAWMIAAIGATVAVAVAGTLTRLATIPAAIAATSAVLAVFVPPLAARGWPGAAGALVLVSVTAASATGARLPRFVAAPATYLGCLLFYLNLVFAHDRSLAGFIPTSRSLAFLARLPALTSADFRFAPPVPTPRPVEFVAAAGVGAVAILVDLLAVRLRRPAMAGLPLLLLFSVPVASSLKNFGVFQTLTFAVGIAAYLALLSADGKQRLRMWGRLVTLRHVSAADEAGAGPDTRALAASGRRVGLAAVCLAMVAPVVLVGSKPHDLFAKSSIGNGLPGFFSRGAVLSPLLKVGPQLTRATPVQVLTYHTNAANPQLQYLQEYVLNYNRRYDSWLTVVSKFHPILARKLPEPVPGLDSGTLTSTVQTTIDLNRTQSTPLPVPYAPVQITSPSAALSEAAQSLMVFDAQDQSNLAYTVTSIEADPTQQELSGVPAFPTSIEHAYGSYGGPDAGLLLRIAERHTRGAVTQLQMAVDLQNWFNSAFTYTTRTSLPARGWLRLFLTSSRRGDCEQFAPAFAVLARLLGIPSRVVVGYTGGQPVSAGVWQVTTADAHAWPELYFLHVGWIRFEPTPSAAGDQATATAPPYTQGTLPPLQTGPSGAPTGSPTGGPSARASTGISKHVQALGGPTGGSQLPGAGNALPVGLVVAAVIFLLLAWPAAGRWLTSRRRWMAASGDAALASAAWREFIDYLADYGLAGPPSESPRATAARVAHSATLTSAAAASATRIGAAAERAKYSLGTASGAGLHADVREVRKAIAATRSWPQRLRARLLPASTLTAVRSGLQSANHALSWLDSPLPSIRRHHGRPAPRRAS